MWFVTGGATVARVFRSGDRGKSWKVAEAPLHPQNASSGLFSIAFADARNGIAVGGDYAHPTGSQSPVVFLTNDGGESWRPGRADESARPVSLFSHVQAPIPRRKIQKCRSEAESDSAEIAAAGIGGIISLGTNGKWTRESEQTTNALAFPTHMIGWAVGPKGAVLRVGSTGTPACATTLSGLASERRENVRNHVSR